VLRFQTKKANSQTADVMTDESIFTLITSPQSAEVICLFQQFHFCINFPIGSSGLFGVHFLVISFCIAVGGIVLKRANCKAKKDPSMDPPKN
jgi:hypothetical protein